MEEVTNTVRTIYGQGGGEIIFRQYHNGGSH